MEKWRETSDRCAMWDNIIGIDYQTMSPNDRKKYKRQYAAERGLKIHQIEPGVEYSVLPKELQLNTSTTTSSDGCFSVTCTTPNKYLTTAELMQSYYKSSPPLDCCPTAQSNQETKEHNMYAKTTAEIGNPDEAKVRYLRDRLCEITGEKKKQAKDTFKIDDDKFTPKSPAEAIARIKAGDFRFNAKKVNDKMEYKSESDALYAGPLCYIEWRNEPADEEGYEAWKVLLNAASQAVEDKIRVLTPEQGLAALQAFETTTIQ